MYKKLLPIGLTLFIISIHAQVNPIIKSTWNQGCYYNDSCPSIGGGQCGKAYTGCNTIAMGQIIYYYKFPNNGWGNYNYIHSSLGKQFANFSTANYNYSNMQNSINTSNKEIAKLLFHLGVSVDMNYSSSNSTSFFGTKTLKKYYQYSPKIKNESKFLYSDSTAWMAVFTKELDAGRPVMASGGGHFYLIDGYQKSPLKFHCNFGWGGLYDGYFHITNINAGGLNVTPINIIINIKPIEGSLELGNNDTLKYTKVASDQYFEFSSAQNWNITTSDTWISASKNNGSAGNYQGILDGMKIHCNANAGAPRKGLVLIKNNTDTDTIFIFQDGNANAKTPEIQNTKNYFYPNPASQLLYYSGAKASNIKIYNLQGKLLFETSKIDSKAIDITLLKGGSYYAVVDNKYASKIIILKY